MAESFLRQAFEHYIPDAVQAEGAYVVLMECQPVYGGPEEGGWWTSDNTVIAYREYPSEELAQKAAEKVRELAKELSKQAKRADSEYCAASMECLEARGLDADFLPEPDGPAEYYVVVTTEVPENSRGSRRYE